MLRFCASFAERDVRIRVRGRIVSVDVQRRQIRIVSVVATAKPAHRQCSRHLGIAPSTLTRRRYCHFTGLSRRAMGFLASHSRQPCGVLHPIHRPHGLWLFAHLSCADSVSDAACSRWFSSSLRSSCGFASRRLRFQSCAPIQGAGLRFRSDALHDAHTGAERDARKRVRRRIARVDAQRS